MAQGTWHVTILESDAARLASTLNEIAREGHQIRFLLPNGINRWCIVSFRPPDAGEELAKRVLSEMGDHT